MAGNQPEKKFSAGAISLTVWRNKGEKGDYTTIQLARNYKDKNNSWKSTNSLRANDIPKAVLLLNKAYEHLTLKAAGSSSENDIEIEEIM